MLLQVLAKAKSGSEKIFYSARYYSPPGSGAASRMHLYSIAARGDKPQQLTSGRFNENAPRISPVGRTLAFMRTRDDTRTKICALDLASKRLKIVLPTTKNAHINAQAWSPKSNTLAIQRESNNNVAL